MSEQEHQPDAPAEEEADKDRLEDLAPSDEDQEALRGGVTPPDT